MTYVVNLESFDESFAIQNELDTTKQIRFDVSGATTGTTTTINAIQSIDRTIIMPDIDGTLLTENSTATITNKTITDATNIVGANELKTTGASVNISAAAPPVIGDVLKATSATTATWVAGSDPCITLSATETIVGCGADGSLGTSNTAVGVDALNAIIATGDFNTAVGFETGLNMTIGTQNTLIGYRAGTALIDGSNNTTLGFNSGLALTTGIQNTLVGTRSGITMTAGQNNTTLGYQSGLNLIGNQNVLLGSFAGDALVNHSNNVIIGYNAGTTFQQNNTTIIGALAGQLMTAGTLNTIIGYNAGSAMTTASGNTLLGYQAGLLLTGGFNVIIGSNAGDALVNHTNNVIIGYNAGTALTQSNTTIIGSSAGAALTTGLQNTLMGFNSGMTLTTGEDNVFIGYWAGRNTGVAVSGCVLIGNTAGQNNTISNRLMIDNVNTNGPLIDGRFDLDTIRFNGVVSLGQVGNTTNVHGITGLLDGSAGAGFTYLVVNVNGTDRKIRLWDTV